MLRGAGYGCIASTTDSRGVYELQRKNRYDLILLDLQMPGMDGFQVMEEQPGIIADSFAEATVLFAGLHDFSRLTERMAATDVVRLLNEIYSGFDALVEKLGLEKIKTIGDTYMVAAGVPVPRADHAQAI